MSKIKGLLLALVSLATSSDLVNAQESVAYVGRQGIFIIVGSEDDNFEGSAALLRLRDRQTGNVNLTLALLTHGQRDNIQAVNWPRSHRGWVFATNLDSARYPSHVFLALDDAASPNPPDVVSPWVHPGAFRDNDQWRTLHLFAKTTIADQAALKGLTLQKGMQKLAGSSYSSADDDQSERCDASESGSSYSGDEQ